MLSLFPTFLFCSVLINVGSNPSSHVKHGRCSGWLCFGTQIVTIFIKVGQSTTWCQFPNWANVTRRVWRIRSVVTSVTTTPDLTTQTITTTSSSTLGAATWPSSSGSVKTTLTGERGDDLSAITSVNFWFIDWISWSNPVTLNVETPYHIIKHIPRASSAANLSISFVGFVLL